MIVVKNLSLLSFLLLLASSCADKKNLKKEDELSSKQYDSLIILGTKFFQNNNMKEAINIFKIAANTNPSKTIGLYRLGVAQVSLCNENNVRACEEGLKNLKKVASVDNNYEKVNYNLGIIYFKIGNYSSSLEFFDKAIINDPTDSDNYVNRALTKLNINDTIGSCADLDKAKSLGDSSSFDLINQYCRNSSNNKE